MIIYKCLDCEKLFDSEENCIKHQNKGKCTLGRITQITKKKNRFMKYRKFCQKCGHEIAVRRGGPKYCKDCCKRFKYASLKQHKRWNHNAWEKYKYKLKHADDDVPKGYVRLFKDKSEF